MLESVLWGGEEVPFRGELLGNLLLELLEEGDCQHFVVRFILFVLLRCKVEIFIVYVYNVR